MPEIYNIYEAKTNFSKLVALTLAGEDIIVGKNNKPLIRFMPFETQEKKKERRKLGDMKGMFTVPDDFDDEDPEINRMFGMED